MLVRLFSVAALASTALAQNLTITLPVAGSTLNVSTNENFIVRLERPASADPSQEVSLLIGVFPCPDGCPSEGLGHILYSGTFDPQLSTSAGSFFQNVSVPPPNWAEGTMQLNVAHLYLLGAITNIAKLELTSTVINVVGATG